MHLFEKYKVDPALVRNYGGFALILALCASALIYVLVSGERKIAKIDDQVSHTYSVINAAQELSALVEGMVVVQRGFIITKDNKFLEQYHDRRDKISELIASLSELTSDNQSQASRLDELRHHFNELSVKLEERAQRFTLTNSSKIILDDIEEIDGLKENILRIKNAILLEEYGLLNKRIHEIDVLKSTYFRSLLLGICASAIMLLLFNVFFMRMQIKQSRTEASLKDTEKRFALAVEGTRDGIFDWNLQTGEVFYSKQFFAMLGYEYGTFIGTSQPFKDVLHPDDRERVRDYTKRYLKGEFPEYSQEFRLKHNDGRWIWIQSRAKEILDNKGAPLRFVGAHTDISQLKDNQARLESEKRAAEESNRAKSDFLAHMSHEIRTPLTAISGIAEIFQQNQGNLDAKQQKLVRTLYSSSSVLKDLINDILDFSKIESGELELDENMFVFGPLFEEVISMMALRANQKGISFIFDYSELKSTDFYGDKTRLRQIIVNLTGNAIKFTKEGGVTVKAAPEERDGEKFLVLNVTDTGIGIAPENFDLIFERFKQADASVSRKYGGTGLGLSISRNLARLMGGNIVLSSELGKGTTFSVYLPWKTKGQKTAAAYQAANIPSPPKGKKKSPNSDHKILMAEDYEGNIVVIGHILEELGYAYDVAGSGSEALSLWAKNYYALVLMDIQMPEMDGFAATKAIRTMEKEKNLPHTPIIGMTAHALVGDKDKCIEAGMDAYLPKPIDENSLKKQILEYIDKKKQAA